MDEPHPPRVALFSEHLLLGEALRSLLEAVGHFHVTSVEIHATPFLAGVRRDAPDLVVLHAGHGVGPEIIGLVERVSARPTVTVVDAVDGRAIELCLAAGARAVLETTTDPVTILAAL